MYELTGTDLIATLKQEEEHKHITVHFKTKKKKKTFPFALVSHKDKRGYLCLSVELRTPKQEALATFESQEEGLNLLFEMTERYELCTKLNGFSQARTYCYNHSIGKCAGACMGDEAVEDYNQRVHQALEHYTLKGRTFVIMDKGRSVQERSVIYIEEGRLRGYGFIELNYQLSKKILQKLILPIEHTPEKAHLLEYYLRKHPFAKQIPIKD